MSGCNSEALACLTACCDIFGACPTDVTGCYYYYPKLKGSFNTTNTSISPGAIIGIVIGGTFGFILLMLLLSSICKCMKPKQEPPTTKNRTVPYYNSNPGVAVIAQPTPWPTIPPPGAATTQIFTAMPPPSMVPPPYYNGQLYNVPEPFYG